MRKKMKNVAAMIFGFALIGAVLIGCGESRQSRQDMPQGIPASISEETRQDAAPEKAEPETTKRTEPQTTGKAEQPEIAGEEIQTSQVYEDNFAVDSGAAKKFAEKVQDVTAQKDLEALAELAAFPIYVGLPDAGLVETKEDFLKLDAEAVFTDELLESIEKADLENFQPCMAGFPITDGRIASISFGVVDGKLAVIAINY